MNEPTSYQIGILIGLQRMQNLYFGIASYEDHIQYRANRRAKNSVARVSRRKNRA